MMNESRLDYSNKELNNNERFKFASDFIENFKANIQSFYSNGEYFVIEFNTEGNYGQLEIASDEIQIKHNVFDDFVEMRKYINNYFKDIQNN